MWAAESKRTRPSSSMRALVGALDTGHAFQGKAFAAAGSPQKARDLAVPGGKGHVQGKAAQPLADIHAQGHHVTSREAGRAREGPFFSSMLMLSSTTAEMARFTSTQVMAPASSPVRQSW